ncbi:uncharacterized protein LOC142332613 [Lycorma delicatula]|uniref:uncharacterized protein LOC142332613 n=1 Tax=Lycorma delicatula TaxID=130591 RepID=UPI003F51A6F8
MMEETVVTDRNSDGASLITSVPVQMVTEARVEVVSKMTPVAVSSNSVQQDLMSAQYINIHRVPAEQLNKVLVPDTLSSDLLTHHVDLTTAADFTQHGVTTQYYDTDDLLTHDLTEDDRRLAAELVAVQFKHQQQHQQQNQILPTSITPLGTVQTVNMDKPTISAAIVTSYIQAVEEEVHQQLLEQQENNDRCIMKIYQQPTTHDIQVLNRQHSQPLPPLKKVLSSQSMVLRNKFSSTPTVMVELPNTQIMNTRSVNDMKVEGIDKANQNVGPTTNVQATTTPQPPPQLPLSTSAQAQCHIQGQGGMTPDDLDSDYDAESDTRPSRRSLPHKKRIPRKLKAPPARSIHTKCYKCNKCGESFNTQAAFSSHKIVHTAPTKQRPSANNLSTAFSCELCNKQFVSQLKFFEHLKHHYEPSSANNIGLSNSNINVNGVNIVNNGNNSSNNNASNSLPELTPAPIVATCIPPVTVHQQQQSLTQQSISSVKSTGQVQPSTSPHNETAQSQPTIASTFSIKTELGQDVVKEEIVISSGLACSQCDETFRKAKTLETHIATVHPRQEEIEEFSEPEDMMEGIRHVVNITNVDSGDEEHCGGNVVDDKVVRWRYQEVHDIGMEDLQDMCLPLPATATLNNHHDHHNQHSGTIANTTAANNDTNNLDDDDLVEDDNSNKIRSGGSNGIVSTESAKKKQLNCTQCERTFNHRNSLLYHIRSHSGQRPHQCEVCGKSFFSASALKVHMRLHSGDKPYKCEFCGRNFRQWGDLKYHVTSLHSAQKQFQCEYCGKDFARKYSLIVHRRIHTGEKNYRCEYCSKTFRASSYLQNHRRIHTGEKPHACDICGKPFRVRSDMKRHRQTHSRERPSSRTNNTTASSAPVITSDQDDNSGGTETILPDNAMSTPLNLNIRQGDSNDGLTYSRTALERDGNTLYVWIPAQPEGNILSDE